jgi:hypothetical protein
MVAVRKNLDLVWVWFYIDVAPMALANIRSKSRRDLIHQPGVARNELRRVIPNKIKNPERVLSNGRQNDSTLSELMNLPDGYPA